MDKSREYINMCEKAMEVQKEWNPQEGDFIRDNQAKDFGYNVYVSAPIISVAFKIRVTNRDRFLLATYDSKHLFTWLPYQRQLQDMVLDKFDCPSHSAFANIINLGHKFREWSKNTKLFNYWTKFVSMEQLWFAFVMKKKYNKVWNNEKWEAIHEKPNPKTSSAERAKT